MFAMLVVCCGTRLKYPLSLSLFGPKLSSWWTHLRGAGRERRETRDRKAGRIGFSGPRAWGYRQARFGDEPFFRALLT